MSVTAAILKVEAGDSEAPSTSCSEDVPHTREQAVSCSVRRAATVAMVMVTALIAMAGLSKTRNDGAVGEKVMGLETAGTWYWAGNFGCSNWKDINISRAPEASKAACAAKCASDAKCTSFNWQKTPCAPPAGNEVPNLCLLFHGSCFPVANTCWELSYRAVETNSVKQTLTVLTSPHPTAADVGAGVKAVLEEDSGFSPVVVTSSELEGPRMNTTYIEYTVEWSYTASSGAQTATLYAVKLANDAEAVISFVDKLRVAKPNLGVTGVNASYPLLGYPTA